MFDFVEVGFQAVIGQEILTSCRVLVPDAEMVFPAHILRCVKSVANPLLFDITLPGEVISFFSDDPQTELSKREVIDFIAGK
jgi:hypothetical protein